MSEKFGAFDNSTRATPLIFASAELWPKGQRGKKETMTLAPKESSAALLSPPMFCTQGA